MSYWTKHSAQVTQRTSVDIRYHRTSASLFTSACHKRFMCVINVNTNVHIWRYPGSTARRSWTKLPLMPSSQIITPPVSIKARAAFIDNDLSHHYNEGNKRSLLSCIRYVDGARQVTVRVTDDERENLIVSLSLRFLLSRQLSTVAGYIYIHNII